MEVGPSPFALIPESEWLCASPLCFAIYDSFPVSPGHVLVITRRVVATYFDCTPDEQAALMQLVGEVRGLLDERLDPKPDGYNVGFNAGAAAGQTVPHVHVHVIPRYSGDMPDPRGGVRHVIPGKGNYLSDMEAPGGSRGTPGARTTHPSMQTRDRPTARSPIAPAPGFKGATLSLTTGPGRPLWPRLAERLPGATEIDLLASFVQVSGLDIVQESLFSALAAGAKVRLLVGDYLGITSPDALRQLLGWIDLAGPAQPLPEGEAGSRPGEGAFSARLVELENLSGNPASFHPKAWRIADSSGGIIVVGSSNLSRAALQTGVEWNLIGETSGTAAIDLELARAFSDLWQQATPLSADVVERYAERAAAAAEMRRVWDGEPARPGMAAPSSEPAATFAPRPWQREALVSLAAIRRDGYSKALVAVATGLGKTWLAAFDCVAIGKELGRPPRVLVIAHRAEILAQAEATLRQAIAPVSVSYVAGSSCDLSGQLVIASIQKLSRLDSLAALAAAAPFDYCVIDEVHHAEAPSYRRVLARLSELSRAAPSFTLGLTATP
ncbi:MAG: DEAD/DEAH box helicase family protein, partial [Planctomycetota bacterium]